MAASRKYTDAEVRAILDRALKQDSPRDLSHDELVAIGSEVGIPREAIDAAARELEERRDTETARTRILEGRRRGWFSHATTYALVIAFLFAINFLSTPGEWWVLFPALGWGLGLVFHARAAFSRSVSEKAIERELRRDERRAARRRAAAGRVRVEPDAVADGDELATESSEAGARAARRL